MKETTEKGEARKRFPATDPRSKRFQRLQRRMDLNNLRGVVSVLRRFGTHDDLAAASLALWCIAGQARKRAAEENE